MEIKYRKYREFEKQRIQANDTMMALLVGSKLAVQTLSLATGSNIRISEMFPEIPHISRLSVKSDRAQIILENAEQLLGELSVPHVLALHEDLIIGMLEFVENSDATKPKKSKSTNPSRMHEDFELLTNHSFESEPLELFHILRLMRNASIHNNGISTQKLSDDISTLSASARQLWKSSSGEELPDYPTGVNVKIGVAELIITLAVTKRIAKSANQALQSTLPRQMWASVLVVDWKQEGIKGNETQVVNKILGFGRTYYSNQKFTKTEILAALANS